MMIFLIPASVAPSLGVTSLVAAAVSMRVTNELQWMGTAGCVLFFGLLLVPLPGDAAERLDFSTTTQFFIWFWTAARTKAFIARFVPNGGALDPKWAKPVLEKDTRFYRRWSRLYFTASVPVGVAALTVFTTHPGLFTKIVTEFNLALGVWASDAGVEPFVAWMKGVEIPRWMIFL